MVCKSLSNGVTEVLNHLTLGLMRRMGIVVIRQIDYRAVREEDFDWLLSLRQITMNPHLLASGFEPSDETHRVAVHTDYDSTRIIVEGRVDVDVGMVKLVTISKPWHLRQIQVAPEFQGQGIGRLVLDQILEKAHDEATSIELNVLRVNPAKRLYETLGFQIVETNDSAYKMAWHSQQGAK